MPVLLLPEPTWLVAAGARALRALRHVASLPHRRRLPWRPGGRLRRAAFRGVHQSHRMWCCRGPSLVLLAGLSRAFLVVPGPLPPRAGVLASGGAGASLATALATAGPLGLRLCRLRAVAGPGLVASAVIRILHDVQVELHGLSIILRVIWTNGSEGAGSGAVCFERRDAADGAIGGHMAQAFSRMVLCHIAANTPEGAAG
mmetsp:Transcript_72912/g.170806  ORF Transcript_72912/g.170806 Transcript_72912/m.170806 type:complete len:201 (+) Transcript_72912:487-1089(+)